MSVADFLLKRTRKAVAANPPRNTPRPVMPIELDNLEQFVGKNARFEYEAKGGLIELRKGLIIGHCQIEWEGAVYGALWVKFVGVLNPQPVALGWFRGFENPFVGMKA